MKFTIIFTSFVSFWPTLQGANADLTNNFRGRRQQAEEQDTSITSPTTVEDNYLRAGPARDDITETAGSNNHAANNSNFSRNLDAFSELSNWFSEEGSKKGKNQFICSSQSPFLSAIYCKGKYCDKLRIECSSNLKNFEDNIRLDPSVTWTDWFSEENNAKECPGDSIVTGMGCKGKYCDNIHLACRKVINKKINDASCYWSEKVSEERGGSLRFDDLYAVIGMKCEGRYCDNKRFKLCNYEEERLPIFWKSDWFSEENKKNGPKNYAECPSIDGYQSTLTGITCKGGYCDNMQIDCSTATQFESKGQDFTTWFSEEKSKKEPQPHDPNPMTQFPYRHCYRGSIVTGIDCKGSYCDNIRLRCTEVGSGGIESLTCPHGVCENEINKNIDYNSCYWTEEWFSEESKRSHQTVPLNTVVVAMGCKGKYCDNKKLKVCDLA